MAGGPVRRADGAVIGAAAVDFVSQFKVDYAVIGTSAIDEDGALLDFDYREVRVARAIIENARQVVLVADRLKLERTAPVRIGHSARSTSSLPTRFHSPGLARVCGTHAGGGDRGGGSRVGRDLESPGSAVFVRLTESQILRFALFRFSLRYANNNE